MEKQGKVCTKCGTWKLLEEYYKNKASKDGRQSLCRECQKEQNKQWRDKNSDKEKERQRKWRENNSEHIKEYKKQWRENNPDYYKSEQQKQYRENNKKHIKERNKQWRENNKEHIKEYDKLWREKNKEKIKQYHKDNEEHIKEYKNQWREENKEHIQEYSKQYREKIKNDNVVQLTEMLKQVNPIFEDLNIKAYGSVYKIMNIKTGRCYIGQTIQPLKRRYTTNIIKGWIEERLEKGNQRFADELKNEKDFIIDEVIAVGVCQYHLDKLEALYIDQYDSCNNGYNNRYGNYNTDDGLEEFQLFLKQYNLQFIDGKLIAI